MITEDDVERAVAFLRDSAPKIGVARADLNYAEAMLRHVKALAMQQNKLNMDGTGAPLAAQEREAYASPQYKQAIDDYRKATMDYETLKAQREGAIAKIDAYQTMSANMRGIRL